MIRYSSKDAVVVQPEGEHEAAIVKVDETVSKSSGKPMYAIQFRVFGPRFESVLTDYAVVPDMLWRLKKLAGALGTKAAQEFTEDRFDPSQYLGSNLRLVLEIEEDAEYGDKNRIKGYKASDATARRSQAAPERRPEPPKDDDIPF